MAAKIAGKILTHYFEHGLRITKMKKTFLTAEDINFIYRKQMSDPTFP